MTNYLNVGDTAADTDQINDLPVGTVITSGSDDLYEREPDGRWHRQDYGQEYTYDSNAFSGAVYRVASLPAGHVVGQRAPETLDRYRWRFRDGVLRASISNGQNVAAVSAALTELGCGLDTFELGTGLEIRNNEDLSNLDEDSVVTVGNPEAWSSFGLFRRVRGVWRPALGHVNRMPGNGTSVRVEQIGGAYIYPEWLHAEPDDDTAAAILEFKERAYHIGAKVKVAQRMCGTYEHTMRGLGVTSSVVRQAERARATQRGNTVDPAGARNLPLGSVLRWQSRTCPNDRVIWFVRTVTSTNLARTWRLFGYRDDGVPLTHYMGTMEVMWNPAWGEPMSLDLRMDDPRVWAAVPAGSRFEYQGSDYEMAADHLMSHPRHGSYRQDSFHHLNEMRCTRIGAAA